MQFRRVNCGTDRNHTCVNGRIFTKVSESSEEPRPCVQRLVRLGGVAAAPGVLYAALKLTRILIYRPLHIDQ